MGFMPVDILIFAAFLCLSIGVGAYHAIKTRRAEQRDLQKSATADFLMGGRKMPIVPIALSLLTTFLSGIMMLGAPAELYQRGVLIWVLYLGGGFAFLVSGLFFVPIFYKMKATSIYEYFELRFESKTLRRMGAALFLLNTLFYMSVVMYAPAVALTGVTHMPLWPFILSVGLASTFYTSIGGLKAVVWTDTLQAGFMYFGIATLIIKGTSDAGGLSKVFEVAYDSGRFDALNHFSVNPAQHNSMWISTMGGVAWWVTMYGLNQMAMQRYCSMPSLQHAKIVIGITIPAFILLSSMANFIGLIMLAYFFHCDPLATGEISSQDQLVILFATRVLSFLPGMPGLFLACLFSGTLSTVSSGMNSMAAVLWEDFLKEKYGSKLSDQQAAFVNKVAVTVFGLASTALAFGAGYLGGLINACLSVMGAVAGPLVGLFFLGIFFPKANKNGAILGLVLSEMFLIWICIGANIYTPYKDYVLPTNLTCTTQSSSGFANHSSLTQPLAERIDLHYGDQSVFYLYRISPFLYSIIGIILTAIVGVPTSLLFPTEPQTAYQRRTQHALTYFGRHEPLESGDSVKEKERLLYHRGRLSPNVQIPSFKIDAC